MISHIATIFKLQKKVYDPFIHILFSLLWFLSLKGTLLLGQSSFSGNYLVWQDILIVVTFYLALFYLRLADEIKDFEYDKVYNPDRPLVQQWVTKKDIFVYMIFVSLLTLGLNLPLSTKLILFIAFELLYGYSLIGIERMWPKVADNIYLNLIFTYPVNIMLSVYTLLYTVQYIGTFETSMVFPIIAFAFAFLFHEFGRKTRWPELVENTARIYSRKIGGRASAYLTLFCGIAAPLIIFFYIMKGSTFTFHYVYLLLFLCWIPAFTGVTKFLRNHTKKQRISTGFTYLITFYTSILVVELLMIHFI